MVFSFSVTTFEMSEATGVVTTGASASTSRVKRTATTDTGTATKVSNAFYQIQGGGGLVVTEGKRARAFSVFKTTKRDAFLTNEQSRFAIDTHKTVSLDPPT